MTWSPPSGAVELLDEPGCWETPNGHVYVHPDTWAEWTHVDPVWERAKELQRKRWLQCNGFRVPSLDELRMWNRYLWLCNEALAGERNALRLIVLDYEPGALRELGS
jgi:hypothetical protein